MEQWLEFARAGTISLGTSAPDIHWVAIEFDNGAEAERAFEMLTGSDSGSHPEGENGEAG